MNLKSYLTFARTGAYAVGVFAAVLGASWIAGQCRQWRTPPAPKPLPSIVDPGTPTPGRVAEAPTLKDSLIVARPDLTVDELRAAAKKYGLELTVKTQHPAADLQAAERRQLDASADVSPQKEAGVVAQTFPMLLAEESFLRSPTGPSVDVSAWLSGFGERVDLRAKWKEWTPPKATSGKMPVCQSASFFQNEAKFVKEIGAGYVYGGGKAGLGGYGSVVYRGFSTGSANWGARGMLAAGQVGGKTTGYGLVAAKVSW